MLLSLGESVSTRVGISPPSRPRLFRICAGQVRRRPQLARVVIFGLDPAACTYRRAEPSLYSDVGTVAPEPRHVSISTRRRKFGRSVIHRSKHAEFLLSVRIRAFSLSSPC